MVKLLWKQATSCDKSCFWMVIICIIVWIQMVSG